MVFVFFTHLFSGILLKILDKKVYEVAVLLKRENIRNAYNDCRDFDYFLPGVEFYYKQNNQNFIFTSSSKQSTRYISYMDTISECIILSKHEWKTLPVYFKKIFEYGLQPI